MSDMVRACPEWSKLCAIRGLMDGWADLVTKVTNTAQEFRVRSLPWPSGSLQIPECSLQVHEGSLQVHEGSLQVHEGNLQVHEGSLQVPEGSLTNEAVLLLL